jgi:hypothetical protein
MNSCGCFGAVQIRPIYTMSLDLAAVSLLLITGRPEVERQNAEGSMQNGEAGKRRLLLACAIGIPWIGIVVGVWLTRPAMAVAAGATQGQTFGNPGELIVLEPENWVGQRLSLADHILADHINIGRELATGQWIVLLVHHDCDHCAAAVATELGARRWELGAGVDRVRLAVVEMPPFADATDPPPWQLPPAVLAGRLDQTRDWFATTPVALNVKDGIVISAKDSTTAETPGP